MWELTVRKELSKYFKEIVLWAVAQVLDTHEAATRVSWPTELKIIIFIQLTTERN